MWRHRLRAVELSMGKATTTPGQAASRRRVCLPQHRRDLLLVGEVVRTERGGVTDPRLHSEIVPTV